MIGPSPGQEFVNGSTTPSAGARPQYGRPDVAVVGTLLLLSGILVWAGVDRGWIPHDEGTLGQSAERVLLGEVPHRDYDEPYTGLLTYLHALAFKVLGTTLLSIRYMLAAAFLGWLGVIYALVRRFLPPLGSGLVVALASAWSVPLYFTGMPSWYNLFLAMTSLLVTFRFMEDGRRRWLFAAGIVGGVSFLIKLPGLYLIAATGLLILRYADGREGGPPGLPLSIGLVGAAVTAGLPVLGHPEASIVVNFAVPILLVAWLLFLRPGGSAALPKQARQWGLWLVVVYLAGVALPVAIFLLLHARAGALEPMLRGVFLLPIERLVYASQPPVGIVLSLVTLLPALVVGGFLWTRQNPGAVRVCLLGGGFLALVVLAQPGSTAQTVVIVSLLLFPLATVALGTCALLRLGGPPRLRAERTIAILVVLAFHGLIQYPFAAFIYFLYVAPLALLGAAALLSLQERSNLVAPAALGVFYLAFALFRMDGTAALPTRSLAPLERMDLERSRLLVPASHRQEYERLVAIVQSKTEGPYIYATPDSPEVYFLSGLRNPTRTLFEFMDEPAGRDRRIIGILEERDVEVVVINRAPGFSPSVSGPLMERLVHLYPNSAVVGRFVVRWREEG